ncbi:MAG: hypothetical protein H6838_11580 [Planctomycetes bacterium]|nr:hypothetical protein [Planctomycetota bacterium]MCB9886126.1 hypothetical protein [Planctomycetota bacterium]
MKVDAARERAGERLLDVGLQELLRGRAPEHDADLRAAVLAKRAADEDLGAPGARRRWLTAALVLLGSCVAIGVSWLQLRDRRAAVQEPGFDVLAPWGEPGPSWTIVHGVQSLGGVGRVSALGISCGDAQMIAALQGRDDIEALMLMGNGSKGRVDEETMCDAMCMAASLPQLRRLSLALGPGDKITARALRELRAAPQLVHLDIDAGPTLDEGVAKAICELPKLRSLRLWSTRVEVAGVRALAGTPSLLALALHGTDLACTDGELFDAVRELRTLRVLSIAPRGGKVFAARHVGALLGLPKLVVLDLGAFELEERTLLQLPTRLEGLAIRVARSRGATSSSLRALGRLSGLRWLSLVLEQDPELTAASAAFVARLPRLERLSCVAGGDEYQWSVVTAASRVRSLFVECSGDVQAMVGACSRLRELESLSFHSPRDLHWDELQALQGLSLPRLRKVVCTSGVRLSAEQRQRLADSLGPAVEVRLP